MPGRVEEIKGDRIGNGHRPAFRRMHVGIRPALREAIGRCRLPAKSGHSTDRWHTQLVIRALRENDFRRVGARTRGFARRHYLIVSKAGPGFDPRAPMVATALQLCAKAQIP